MGLELELDLELEFEEFFFIFIDSSLSLASEFNNFILSIDSLILSGMDLTYGIVGNSTSNNSTMIRSKP